MTDTPQPGSVWPIPYKSLAIASVIFGMASLTVLVVVVGVKHVDILSTVALTLAIITFVVQLIVYIAQTGATSEQVRQSQQLFGDSQQLLTAISEKAASIQSDVRTMSEKMLTSILEEAQTDILHKGEEPTSPTFPMLVAERAGQILEAEQSADRTFRTSPNMTLPSSYIQKEVDRPEDWEQLRRLQTFPEDRDAAISGMTQILNWSRRQKDRFSRLAKDEKRYRNPRSTLAPGLPLSIDDADRTLAPYVETITHDGQAFTVLTSEGRELARLLIAPDPVPDYLADLAEIRSDTLDE